MIPYEWRIIPLSKCTKGKGEYGANASALSYDCNLPRFIRITDILDSGKLSQEDKKSIPEDKAEGFILTEGDFLFARTGATVGKTYRYTPNGERQAYAGYLIKFKIDSNVISPKYLELYTQSQRYWDWVRNTSRAGAQPNINAQEFGELEILLPTNVEQEKICKIIDNWKRAIDLTESLIVAKQERRTWLIQKLLTGQLRVPGFSKKWVTKCMKDLVEQIQRPVPKPTESYKALGIRSHCKGTFERLVSDPNTVDMDELYIAEKGDLIVNITFAWEGAIAIVPEEHSGNLVSHRFPTYTLNENEVDAYFLRYVVTQPRFIFTLRLISPGGAGRNRVMSKRDFLNIQLSVPCMEEQRKIGKMLKLVDEEIALLSTQLDALWEQKKGLMQKLLTGKLRVKLDS